MSGDNSVLFEIRTLLMSAIGMLELASGSKDGDSQSEYQQIALTTLRTLQKLFEKNQSRRAEPRVEASNERGALVGEGKKILLAEDNEINRRVVTKFLSSRGFDVTSTENGLSALAQYDRGKFDLVLLDIMMPELDGFDTAKRIKEFETKEGRTSVPIIALTALEESDHPELNQLFDGVIMKPFNSNSLLGVIARICTEE